MWTVEPINYIEPLSNAISFIYFVLFLCIRILPLHVRDYYNMIAMDVCAATFQWITCTKFVFFALVSPVKIWISMMKIIMKFSFLNKFLFWRSPDCNFTWLIRINSHDGCLLHFVRLFCLHSPLYSCEIKAKCCYMAIRSYTNKLYLLMSSISKSCYQCKIGFLYYILLSWIWSGIIRICGISLYGIALVISQYITIWPTKSVSQI